MGYSRAAWAALAFVGSFGACANSDHLVGWQAEPTDAGVDSSGAFGGEADADDGGAECPARCSSDLHSLVNCRNETLSRCPDDKGCAGKQCVEPCTAAELNQSSTGCDFFTAHPPVLNFLGGCFAAVVSNVWTTPVTLSVDWAGSPLDVTRFAYLPSGSGPTLVYRPLRRPELAPGEVALLFLGDTANNSRTACPMPHGVDIPLANLNATAIQSAFHIHASAPVSAFDIYPYGGSNTGVAGATLLLPTSVWNTNYVAITPGAGISLGATASPWISITANADDTHVTLQPPVAITGGEGVEGVDAGVAHTYALARGQVLQLVQATELVGTTLQSDKPVGLSGGHMMMGVPDKDRPGDAIHQQIPPVKALGHEYVGIRYRDRYEQREERPVWRVIGIVDGTELTYEPDFPEGAPATLARGESVPFRRRKPFLVKSQDADHPFYLAQYMSSCEEFYPEASGDCRGDTEFVGVVPPAQYLQEYSFFTDPTYSETHLVVTRAKTAAGFADVELDCAGKLTGWQPFGDYEWTHVDLVRNNFEPQGNCDNGGHVARSAVPFGLTVWGWGSAKSGGASETSETPGIFTQGVSYAYAAGASVRPVTNAVVPIEVK